MAKIITYDVNTRALVNDAIKGVLRSLGDAGDNPANVTGQTVLKLLNSVLTNTNALTNDAIKGILRTLGDAGDNPANVTGYTALKWLNFIENRIVQLAYQETLYGTSLRTSTPLSANAVFEDSWADLYDKPASNMVAVARADVAGTLQIEQSDDGVNPRRRDEVATEPDPSGGQSALLKVYIGMRYARVRYVNGGTAQTFFRLSRRLHIA